MLTDTTFDLKKNMHVEINIKLTLTNVVEVLFFCLCLMLTNQKPYCKVLALLHLSFDYIVSCVFMGI